MSHSRPRIDGRPLGRLLQVFSSLTIAVLVAAGTASDARAAPGPKKSADTTAPQTTITAGPPTPVTATSASISFASNEPGTFDCRLDAAAFASCTSPTAYTGLSLGEHTVLVRARDAAGNVDATPAAVTWQITAPTPGTCAIDPPDGQDAITAAIRACPDGSRVSFPAGTSYTQTATIVVDQCNDLTIDGNGSTFTKTSPSVVSLTPPARPNWELSRNTNVAIEDMTVRGSFAGCTPRCADNTTNQFDHGFNVVGGDGTTIRDVSVRNVYGEFVTVQPYGNALGTPARNVRVQRLNGMTAKRQCVAPIGVIGFWLEDSRLEDCHQNGVDVEQDVAGEPLRDIHILRNTISGTYFSAITVPQANGVGDVDGVEIRGNVTETAPDTCYPAILVGETTTSQPMANVVTAANRVLTQGNGIVYRKVASGSISDNSVTITRSPFWCGLTTDPSVAVRLIESQSIDVAGTIANGY